MQLRLKRDVTEMEREVMKVQNKRFKKMETQERGDMVSEGKEYREIWKVEEKEKKTRSGGDKKEKNGEQKKESQEKRDGQEVKDK